MARRALVNRVAAVGAYLATTGLVTLLIYPNLYFESQLAFFALLAVVSLFGGAYPGTSPASSLLYIAFYLYLTYASGSVRYVLPYATVAMFSILLVLVVPVYLSTTKIRKLDDIMSICYHLVVYTLSITWIRSMLISMSLFAALSTLSSGAVAAVSVTSYTILVLLTTYASQFSVNDISELKAVPAEFLKIPKEHLGYDVILRLSVALMAYLIGLTLVRLADRKFPTYDKGTLKGALLEVLKRSLIAVPLSLITAYTFNLKPMNIAEISVYTLAFVGTLSLAKSYQEGVTSTYSYIWESRDLIESIEYKVVTFEEVLKYFREGELSSLSNLGEFISRVRARIKDYVKIISSTIPSYSKTLRAYEELTKLNTELDQKFESLTEELRELIKVSYTIGQVVPKGSLAMISEELEAAHTKAEKWKALRSLTAKISEVLKQYCDIMHEILRVSIPKAYYELLGFTPVIRDVQSCTDLGVKAIQVYQDYVALLLLGLDTQLDAAIGMLSRLAEEAGKLSKLTGTYEVKNPYVLELLRIYQTTFSQAHTLSTSDSLSKLNWIVDVKKSAIPSISSLLRRVMSIKLEVEELGRTLATSLEPIKDALNYIDDPETSLVDLIPVLSRVLRVVFNTLGPLSEIGIIIASLHVLEKVGPLVEDYIKEGLRQGYRFEEIFPLRENLRWLWTLLYGPGDEGAV